MVDVKKVEKTAESGGFQNVAPADAPADDNQPKTLAEARALKAKEDGELAEAQAANREEVAERDKNKAEPKPSKRAEKEMARGGENIGGAAKVDKK